MSIETLLNAGFCRSDRSITTPQPLPPAQAQEILKDLAGGALDHMVGRNANGDYTIFIPTARLRLDVVVRFPQKEEDAPVYLQAAE